MSRPGAIDKIWVTVIDFAENGLTERKTMTILLRKNVAFREKGEASAL